jgi:hypothetical protein
LRLEAAPPARRGRAIRSRFAADDPAHRGIMPQESFTSSYPARRPNTDCRNNPANACRPFLPVCASGTMLACNDPAFARKTTFLTLACKRDANVIAKEIAVGV